MANFVGKSISETAPTSEKKVANALRRLNNEWHILHSVSWQSKRGGRQGDGEADFLLIHPRYGGLVAEVKGGGISVKDGQWLSQDRNGNVHAIKNPFHQARDSKYALVSWINDRFPSTKLPLGHVVIFPDLDSLEDLGPEASRSITWNAEDLSKITIMLEKTVAHWDLRSSLSNAEFKAIVTSLAPTIHLRRKLASVSSESEQELIKLTAEQIEIYGRLRAKRGGQVLGAAGTGKTVLAIARARQLAEDGFKTCLVCYNELLGKVLAESLSDAENLTASTYHGLCFKIARKARIVLPEDKSTAWWDKEAPILLIEAAVQSQISFDAVVVDEGQDFFSSWLDSLRCLQNRDNDAPFFLFADPYQTLWARDWTPDGEWGFTSELNTNLRNTLPIAQKTARTINIRIPDKGTNGSLPKWIDSTNPKRREGDVLSAIENLLDEGFGSKRFVILCASSERARRLHELTVADNSLGRWGSNGIVVETIARFKGLEAEATIVVLEEGDVEPVRSLFYVGFSRARSVLVVVGPPSLKVELNWN